MQEVADAGVVGESNEPDGTKRTVVRSPTHGRSTSSTKGSEHEQTFEGRPTQNEGNVPDAVHRLADKLNVDAGARLWVDHAGGDGDDTVDGRITGPNDVVKKCQVTRVERATNPDRGRLGTASSHNDRQALVDAIVEAAKDKHLDADPSMALVLDTNDAPAYTDDPGVAATAVAELRDQGLLGHWAEIWLVGPTVQRTTRLDPPEE